MNEMPKIDTASARPANIEPAEWETRVDLAACYRLVDFYGMTDLHLNHISARVPGHEEHFLINPFGMMYEEITASSLIKVDLDGKIISNSTDYGINLAGYVIHSAIHGARHDVGCVLHTHTNAGMAVSVLKCGLLPLTQTAMRWGKIAYHDFEGVAVEIDERQRLVDDLGDCEVMILRNHGFAFGRADRWAGVQQHLSPGAGLSDPASGARLQQRNRHAAAIGDRQVECATDDHAVTGCQGQESPARLAGMAGLEADAGPPRPVV
jgi:ribulose-5-phosphate 4-epimerase/fuculose-1-phosphate aldolase